MDAKIIRNRKNAAPEKWSIDVGSDIVDFCIKPDGIYFQRFSTPSKVSQKMIPHKVVKLSFERAIDMAEGQSVLPL